MDLTILMIIDHGTYKRSERIEFLGIKDFSYTKDYISFIQYGRLSETNIETEKVIEFAINNNDNLFD